MKRLAFFVLILLSSLTLTADVTLSVTSSGASLRHGRLHLEIEAGELAAPQPAQILIDGREVHEFELVEGKQTVTIEAAAAGSVSEVTVRTTGAEATTRLEQIPGWLSILPPLIAIALALLFKDVLIALFAGVFSGAMILYHWNPIRAFARTIDSFVAPALADGDHAKIIIFSVLLGGMVGLITRSGGTQGIVERIKGFATNARRGQVTTWVMGIFIFFDDYANSLIVGSTMRPITDRLRISREKLAYIVDSTAAPVASIFPISTWIGFEIGLIAAAFTQLDLPFNAYTTLIASIPYRFYPIFALVLGFAIAFTCRDFGPMLRAERRASETGKVIADGDTPLADYNATSMAPPDGIPKRARNALIPIFTVIAMTIIGLFVSGSAAVNRADYPSAYKWLQDVFSNASSLDALLWASLTAVVVALLLPLAQRLLTIRQAMDAMVEGFKAMLLALIVLVLAWSIGSICAQLHTADFVVGLTQGVLSPHWLPVLVFIASAAISFATGTSWGTMGILMPLVIPIAHGLSLGAGHPVGSEAYHVFMLGTISSVLAGSVWGDHCSPISDTTILSSMGSGSDHIAHVRTQLPYAFAIGILGMLIGDIATAFGLNVWLALALGSAMIVGAVLLLGKRSDWQAEQVPSP
ncbi:MAG TPA: Na+/H+ antiporter NhaC family protein [Thermoanaerobaculia bacterium]|nr:Na+/H+ antiporter NhaC family protein [Thermoanaerobaculia bacterium]